MPKLGDFIGALLSDAVQARVRADMESLKIAEAYSGHDLLKHLPVPRFRLPDISVDFPVAVSSMEGEPQSDSSLFIQPEPTDYTNAVRRALTESGIRPTLSERLRIYAAVKKSSQQLFSPGSQALFGSKKLSTEIAKNASSSVKRLVQEPTQSDNLAKLESVVKDSMHSLLLSKIVRSPHLQVGVSSNEIKSHGDSQNLLRVRLTISEDAYELTNQGDDSDGFTLTPE